jgi:putative IMPACT (imprinted ancient) family translation regulator
VAVVRVFGGIKLGTGGLARAYGGVARAALDAAPRRTVRRGRRWQLVFPYDQQKTLRQVLAGHEGHTEQEDYGATVAWTVWLPRSRGEAFVAAVREATAGRVVPGPAPDAGSPDRTR